MMLPSHVAIIMDGNGRWARLRKLPRVAGHRAGMENLRKIVSHVQNKGIKWLTVYAFSSENWARPAEEVVSLLSLLKIFIRQDLKKLHNNNVKVRVIGDRSNLSADIVALLSEAEETTKDNDGLNLVVAFNYGSRDEIVRATKKIVESIQQGQLAVETITEDNFSSQLDTCDIPDPDLIIRTGGEVRLSNFLLWQAAYAEFIFVADFWPDFTEDHFDNVMATYCKRERRYGKLLSSDDGNVNSQHGCK